MTYDHCSRAGSSFRILNTAKFIKSPHYPVCSMFKWRELPVGTRKAVRHRMEEIARNSHNHMTT